MYYFFGAGNNCIGALKFFGKEKIIAIIDNNSSKIGTMLEGIPIISFDKFVKEWKGETVIITAFIQSDDIVKQLKENSISNYFVCPHMQSGFLGCDEIIKEYNLLEYSKIIIYDKNPITDLLAEKIIEKKEDCFITFMKKELDVGECKGHELLLIAKEEYKTDDILRKHIHVVNLYEEIEKSQYSKYKYLQEYKNIHANERCFIIGNGPSLTKNDLEKICVAGDISFGSNGIHQIFSSTKWRPTYYVIGDAVAYEKYGNSLPANMVICFIRDFYSKGGRDGNINWYNSKGERYYPRYPQFSKDLVGGVYGGRTVTYDMLQIAVYMGFTEIYLLGVDFSWGESGKATHFYSSVEEDRMTRDAVSHREDVEHAYISAKNYADANEIKIYNATRGGQLDVFERVDFDSLFDLV